MAHNRDYKPEDILFPNQSITESELVGEMQKSYIEYAMSVIVGRALPDVRDGLKPVHRRILYAMYEDGLTQDKPFRKCATAVGDVLGRYHPHGDASVYDALVRMAQDFSMRYPLIDGHGNFGSVDGDPPAAYRYTEARMAKLAGEMLRDIDRETVDFIPNFDETRKEPVVLPSRIPNLLVNGSSGIAVGMATNIPPHNMRETIGAAICLLENPDAGLNELMEHIKGPDFPTRGIIIGRAGIRAAYATGKGHITVRARAEFEEHGNEKQRVRIIVTELPYQVNKRQLIKAIADKVRDKTIDEISDIRDESDRNGMRIVIELKRDANPQVVLNKLYSQTQMQTTFAITMLALVNDQKQPKILSLKHILEEYLAFQTDVLTRRTRYDLRKARERAHLLEGLIIAQDNIDEVIRIIRESYDDAKERLMERFGLDDVQATAILDMRLKQLQKLDREKLLAEYREIEGRIDYYESLLREPAKLRGVLKDELTAVMEKYGDERKTEIQDAEGEIDIEDLIDKETCVFTISRAGYIKRMPADTYRVQRRGGKGVTGMTTKEEDSVENLFTASTHDFLLLFTSYGQVYKRKGYTIPEASRTAKGTNIANIIPVRQGELLRAALHMAELPLDRYLVFVTKNGTVKRMKFEELKNLKNIGMRAITLDENDELIAVLNTSGEDYVLIATHDGMAICFRETDARAMGRTAAGVRGISLREGDFCVGAVSCTAEDTLLTVAENGYGKRTPVSEYTRGEDPQHRGGMGLKNYNVTAKTGKVAGIHLVNPGDHLMLMSSDGIVIRMEADSISLLGRAAQGVKIMSMAEGTTIIGLTVTAAEEDDAEESAEASPEEAPDAPETDPADGEA